jgi:hypothetical protein
MVICYSDSGFYCTFCTILHTFNTMLVVKGGKMMSCTYESNLIEKAFHCLAILDSAYFSCTL